MNLVVVEREKKEARRLIRLLRLLDPSITVVRTVNSLASGLSWIKEHPHPDVILINHSQLESLPIKDGGVLAKLVLKTKQDSLAYLAFRIHTIRQVLQEMPQPATKGVPLKAVKHVEMPGEVETSFKKRFLVESGQRMLSIAVNEIAYFFSDGRFVYLNTFNNHKYIVHYRMDALENLLHPQEFYRINRSYIVSLQALAQIRPYFGSRFKLKLNPSVNEEVLVSRNRAPGFRKWLGE